MGRLDHCYLCLRLQSNLFALHLEGVCGMVLKWVRRGINIIIFFRRMRKHSIPNFIQKTWEMLEEERHWAIVSWNADGTSFQIHNECLFSEDLLPHYFKHSNFASFIRQLNMYNFHKRKTPTGNTEFYHKLFRRNHSELLIGIRRKPSQAEMLEAELLLRKLAPECIEEEHPTPDLSSDAMKSPTKLEETGDINYIPETPLEYYPTPVWIFTPYFAHPYQWTPEKNMKTNIIIQRVEGQGRQEASQPPAN